MLMSLLFEINDSSFKIELQVNQEDL